MYLVHLVLKEQKSIKKVTINVVKCQKSCQSKVWSDKMTLLWVEQKKAIMAKFSVFLVFDTHPEAKNIFKQLQLQTRFDLDSRS